MNPETIREIAKALEPLANKLGTTAQAAFGWAVRDAVITGWQCVAWASFLFLLAAVVITGGVVMGRKDNDRGWIALGGIIGALLIFVCAGILTSGLGCLLNPEWHAVQSLLGVVK